MAKTLTGIGYATQGQIDYRKQLENILNNKKKELVRQQQQEIIKVYEKAYKDIIEKGLKKAGGDKAKIDKLTKVYAEQIYNELELIVKQYNADMSSTIETMQAEIMMSMNIFEKGDYYEFKEAVDKAVNVANRKIVQQMVEGKVYHDGKGLDKRIWDSAKMSGTKMSTAINSCIAQGMGAADMSQNLKEFAMGGHHTWSRNKIREKLGDGYARKYGSGGLDYEALRLARTTLTHQAQISVINSSKVNPYLQFVKWHSDHQAGRTCQQCIDRDGQLFKIDEVPLDHPNGMCWIQPVYSIDGKTEATPEEIAKDMKAWAEGSKNSKLMDKIPEYKGLGGKVKAKIGNVAEQIARTIAANKAELQNNYKVITEDYIREYHILSGKPTYNDMPFDDRFAYNLYVKKMDSLALNRRLYTGQYGKKKGRRVHPRDEQINKFTALVAKDNLKDNSRFVRFVGEDYISGIYKQLKLSNIPDLHSDKGILDLNVDLMDKIVTNEAFTSVSYDQNANVFKDKPVMMEIYADKGLECLYTFNYKESEVVLQRGTQFKIKGIELVEDKDKWGNPISYIKIIAQAVSKK